MSDLAQTGHPTWQLPLMLHTVMVTITTLSLSIVVIIGLQMSLS